MGLDQYARYKGKEDEEYTEFKYWRKCNHIQNWFQKIYAEETGDTDPSNFNCKSVQITPEIVTRFVDDVTNKRMQCIEGFFFGYSYDPSEESVIEEDVMFAAQCLMHLSMNSEVVYSSWW